MRTKVEYRTDVFEYERGYGRRRLLVNFYATKKEALEAVEEFNKDLPDSHCPDCYIQMEFIGKVGSPVF